MLPSRFKTINGFILVINSFKQFIDCRQWQISKCRSKSNNSSAFVCTHTHTNQIASKLENVLTYANSKPVSNYPVKFSCVNFKIGIAVNLVNYVDWCFAFYRMDGVCSTNHQQLCRTDLLQVDGENTNLR